MTVLSRVEEGRLHRGEHTAGPVAVRGPRPRGALARRSPAISPLSPADRCGPVALPSALPRACSSCIARGGSHVHLLLVGQGRLGHHRRRPPSLALALARSQPDRARCSSTSAATLPAVLGLPEPDGPGRRATGSAPATDVPADGLAGSRPTSPRAWPCCPQAARALSTTGERAERPGRPCSPPTAGPWWSTAAADRRPSHRVGRLGCSPPSAATHSLLVTRAVLPGAPPRHAVPAPALGRRASCASPAGRSAPTTSRRCSASTVVAEVPVDAAWPGRSTPGCSAARLPRALERALRRGRA